MAILMLDSDSSARKQKRAQIMSSRGATSGLFKQKFGWMCKLFSFGHFCILVFGFQGLVVLKSSSGIKIHCTIQMANPHITKKSINNPYSRAGGGTINLLIPLTFVLFHLCRRHIQCRPATKCVEDFAQSLGNRVR